MGEGALLLSKCHQGSMPQQERAPKQAATPSSSTAAPISKQTPLSNLSMQPDSLSGQSTSNRI